MNKHSNNPSYHSFQYIELNEIDTTNQSIQQYIKSFALVKEPPNNHNHNRPPSPFQYYLFPDFILTPKIKKRLIAISLFITIIFLNNNLGLLLPSDSSITLVCISDSVFNLTSSLNEYFHYNILPRYILTTVSSLLIDFIFCYSLIDWAFNYTGLRLVLCWGVFYIIRGIIQNIYQMTYPPGFFWGSPYFPSLVVSYLITNDFFFSGHVGMPLMAGLHYYHLTNKKMSSFCFCTVGIELFLVIITRQHYSIDVVVGLSFSHYVFILANNYVKYIDDWITGMNEDNDIKDHFLKHYIDKV